MKNLKYKSILIFIILSQNLFANQYSLSGYIKDIASRKPLIGANIFVEGTSIGSATDKTGLYRIDGLEEGSYSFKASYIGYKSSSEQIDIKGENKDIFLDFNLNYMMIEGNEVIVTAQARGQMDAINRQLNSKSLVNIISSDRIQELQFAQDSIRANYKSELHSIDPDFEAKDSDYIFLTFILNFLPHGLIGLLLAVIFSAAMS